MDFDVSVPSAFLAGLISFLSPCVLPIVPPYLCFLAGVGVQDAVERTGGVNTRRLVITAIAFVAGFSTVFVALGATASALGQLVADYLQTLSVIAGVLIIAMGLHFLGVVRISSLLREHRVQVSSAPAGLIGAYVMGLAFAFGWTPCVGPILATILFVAGGEDTVLRGAGLLLVYALGIGIPFILVALFLAPAMHLMNRFKPLMGHIERAMGVILVITGVLFLTGTMSDVAYWILETFPALGRIG